MRVSFFCMKGTYSIGIDEVGRGPLAGPVTVAAVLLPRSFKFCPSHPRHKLRDSKRISPLKREQWFSYITEHPRIRYAVSSVSPALIDRINVAQAANLAATRALMKLVRRDMRPLTRSAIFLDGGLFVREKMVTGLHYLPKPRTIIGGDEKIPAIMFASIVAKVRRDRFMVRLHKTYPRYGFARHKGYGTREHATALLNFGPSPAHRLTFIRKYLMLDTST